MSADNRYEEVNDSLPNDAPAGDKQDNDYASRTGQSEISVVKDDAQIEDPYRWQCCGFR